MTANSALVLTDELTPVRGRFRRHVLSPVIWLSFVVIAGVLAMAVFGALLARRALLLSIWRLLLPSRLARTGWGPTRSAGTCSPG